MFTDNDSQGKERRVGLYATVSFHLGVLIILLCISIGAVWQKESSFVLDFTRQDELEKEQREEELKEQVTKDLDQMFGARSNVRNVAVDAGGKLKDDRFRNPNEVYEEAKALQKKLDASKRDALAEKAAEEAVDMSRTDAVEDNGKPVQQYSGPSVISWRLEGRKARLLPVPAYKGYGSGDVYVQIFVNKNGRVTSATVIQGPSSTDSSLQEYAIEAAKRSRFSASSTAPSSQQGEIVYRFIAQ